MNVNGTIYAIYSLEDKDLVLNLLNRLKSSDKDSNNTIWDDDPIKSGQAWSPKDATRLQKADAFFLFASNSFMYSEFIQQNEFKMIIDRYKDENTTVIPILIDNCPWETEFSSDDYNFSFKELQVLPKNRKPISRWDSRDDALNHIAKKLKKIIAPEIENAREQDLDKKQDSDSIELKKEEQIALDFTEEKEDKTQQVVDSESEKRLAEEIRLRKEAEAKRSALEEKKQIERVKAEQKAKELAQIKANEEQKLHEAAKINQKPEHEVEPITTPPDPKEVPVSDDYEEEENVYRNNNRLKNRALIGIAAALAALAIWFFLDDKAPSKISATEATKIENVSGEEVEKIDAPKEVPQQQKEILQELVVGDSYKGGIIFKIDASGKSGTLASYDDVGPMSWSAAMKIHEELGEGWRLPSLDELRLMRQTIGQGATNDGEFSDGLYWSATDYDEYQARVMRFRDGNTSYHYNKVAENRKFRVRPIRDFTR